MSLINRMLQDLEERRTDGSGSSSIHDQVRVAPQARRIPLTWAFGLAAVLVATALLSWLWGRQTAPVTLIVQNGQPQLALKLASAIKPAGVQPESAARSQVVGSQATMDAQPAAAHVLDPMPAVMPPLPLAANEKAGPPERTMNAAPGTAPTAAMAAPAASVPAAMPVEAADHSASRIPVREPSSDNAAPHAPEAPASTRASLPAVLPKLRMARDAPTQRSQGGESELPVAVTKQIKEAGPQQRADAEYLKASSLIQQGRNGEALPVLEQALRLDPQNATVRQTLAGLLVEAKRNDEAIARLQEGLETDRAQTGMAMLLARLQVDKGDLRPAIDTLQRTQSYAGDRADYQAFMAALYQRDSRHKEAVDRYIAALRKSPQNGIWWMGLGISLQAENRLNEARDAFVRSKATSSLPPDLLAFVEQKVSQLR